jgi:hypothetical protein
MAVSASGWPPSGECARKNALKGDTRHKALCPVSRYVDRAYLWAPALGTGHRQ